MDVADIFHNKCDNRGYTLSIIKSNKGHIFGGYTTKTWSGDGIQYDSESFLFSVNKNQKYSKSNNNAGNFVSSKFCLSFNRAFLITNDCMNNEKSYTHNIASYYSNCYLQSEIDSDDREYFTVVDFEVFRI